MRKTTDAQQIEMITYGIKIISDSEIVSKFPRSITAASVADATSRRSIEIRVKRRNVPTLQPHNPGHTVEPTFSTPKFGCPDSPTQRKRYAHFVIVLQQIGIDRMPIKSVC
jgi:hypothetical protein